MKLTGPANRVTSSRSGAAPDETLTFKVKREKSSGFKDAVAALSPIVETPSPAAPPPGLLRADTVNWAAMRQEIEAERQARRRAEARADRAEEKASGAASQPSEVETADILHGYAEVGAFLRMTASQAEHRARAGEIPVFKLGRTVCARRSTLNAWLADQEAKPRHRSTEEARHGDRS